jgi:mRNA interferase RelE/StbE
MTYAIEISDEAMVMLSEIVDRRIRLKLLDRIGKLAEAPKQQGKPLADILAGFRSVRAVGQRYRIIYMVHRRVVKVVVVGVGLRSQVHRKDVYSLTGKARQKG